MWTSKSVHERISDSKHTLGLVQLGHPLKYQDPFFIYKRKIIGTSHISMCNSILQTLVINNRIILEIGFLAPPIAQIILL